MYPSKFPQEMPRPSPSHASPEAAPCQQIGFYQFTPYSVTDRADHTTMVLHRKKGDSLLPWLGSLRRLLLLIALAVATALAWRVWHV